MTDKVTPPNVHAAFAMLARTLRQLEVARVMLGDINVEISTPDPDKFVDSLAGIDKVITAAKTMLAERERYLMPPKEKP